AGNRGRGGGAPPVPRPGVKLRRGGRAGAVRLPGRPAAGGPARRIDPSARGAEATSGLSLKPGEGGSPVSADTSRAGDIAVHRISSGRCAFLAAGLFPDRGLVS